VQERPYGPAGAESRCGIRRFSGGAKVWVPDGYEGMGYETVVVIGRPRGSQQYAVVSVGTRYLTNLAVKLIYSPTVLALLEDKDWPASGRGFSAVPDPTSGAYRADLEHTAARFQERTDDIHRQWARCRAERDQTHTWVAAATSWLRRTFDQMRAQG
jgi:hypothetical protein